jgi:Kdo2-lipid IVA lauroyltransferase/acyltransferase
MVFLFRLLSRLPLRLVASSRGMAWAPCLPAVARYRRNLQENMAQAGIDKSLRGLAAAEAGKQMLELSRIWMRPLDAACAQVVEVKGWEHVEAALQAKKGIVFLTPHLGCFEIVGQYLSRFGDITVLYRPPKSAAAQKMILTGRQRGQQHLAPADLSGVRSLIKALRKGQMVGMLPDQAPKNGEGVWLKFFGRYGLHHDAGGSPDRNRCSLPDDLGRTIARRTRLSIALFAAQPTFDRFHGRPGAADK